MKYVRVFWILAIVLFITPFLGIPQGAKDVIIIMIAFILGFLAWVRSQTIKMKRKMLLENRVKENI